MINPQSTIAPAIHSQATRTTVVYRALTELKPDPKNPRSHSPRQVKQIAKSIDTFGFNVPILIDASDKIIAGHGRALAALKLGWTEVPTICLEHLTDAQARAYMIADNRLTEHSSWNDALLAEQLHDLSLLNLDFNLDVIGFDMGEIDFRIENMSAVAESKEDPADLLPALSPVAVTQVSDHWYLGEHRFLCGNALDPAALETLMGDQRAHVVFTDPPYNVTIDGNVGGKGHIKHREFAMACGEMSIAEFTQFLSTCFKHMAKFSVPGSIHFICMDFRHMTELLTAGSAVYSELKNLCVWAKDTGGMGSLYRSQHELIFVFKYGTEPHTNNVQLGKYGRNRTNVWRYPGVNSFAGRNSEEGNLLTLHPTVKPVAMVADALLDCSNRGDIVLDAFLGSGTTLMAAERTGRICYGLELDPLYVDTIIRRWQIYTGQHAIHAVTGQTFYERENHPTAQSNSETHHGV